MGKSVQSSREPIGIHGKQKYTRNGHLWEVKSSRTFFRVWHQ